MITAIALAVVFTGIAAAFLGWSWHWIVAGGPIWPVVIGAVLLPVVVPFVASVLWFTLAAIFGTPVPPDARLSLRQRASLFWNEMLAIGRSGPRMILYRWLMRDPPPAPAETAVLLLHGVLCNAGVWVGMKRMLQQRVRVPIYAMSYGPPLASIEVFADQLAARIDAILAATGARDVALVCHSMGGLVARAYVRRHGAAKLRLLLTLGTPHHGSMHAYLFPGTSLAQLRPGNPWLAALGTAPHPGCRVVSLWSTHDSMVAPQASSRLDGATEIVISGVGHNALLGDPAVVAAVLRELAASGVSVVDAERPPASG